MIKILFLILENPETQIVNNVKLEVTSSSAVYTGPLGPSTPDLNLSLVSHSVYKW